MYLGYSALQIFHVQVEEGSTIQSVHHMANPDHNLVIWQYCAIKVMWVKIGNICQFRALKKND